MYYLEQMFYESRPFIYALIGFYALAHYDSRISLLSGITLLGCSTIVFVLRTDYRDKLARAKATANILKRE